MACGCYCGITISPPCSEQACKTACGWRPDGRGGGQQSACYPEDALALARRLLRARAGPRLRRAGRAAREAPRAAGRSLGEGSGALHRLQVLLVEPDARGQRERCVEVRDDRARDDQRRPQPSGEAAALFGLDGRRVGRRRAAGDRVKTDRRDAELRRIYNAAWLTTPDGMPLAWLARQLGLTANTERVYGPTLMRQVLDHGREHRLVGAVI